MSHTEVILTDGVWTRDEWPEFVTVEHESDAMRSIHSGGEPRYKVYVPERTCHAVGNDGKPYEPDQSCYLLEAHCDECWGYLGGRDQSHVGEYCPECGAKLVER